MSAQPLHHQSHHYPTLVQRWKALARRARLKIRSFAKADGLDVYVITSPEVVGDERPTIYISAGVHGDEPAAPWGLLQWAEQHVDILQRERFLIFPTLNPHGLILNTRHDHHGRDLNRSFNQGDDPLIIAWRDLLEGRSLSLALCLHEDYDGQGCYLYELLRQQNSIGHALLEACADIIPPDLRRTIDGRRADRGLLTRRRPPELAGQPEAIVLHYLGAPLTLTFETPSEFSLTDRVAAQERFISAALQHALHLL